MRSRKVLIRGVIIIVAILSTVALGYIFLAGFRIWSETSYAFVFAFLVLILFSNIYAKLALAYLNA